MPPKQKKRKLDKAKSGIKTSSGGRSVIEFGCVAMLRVEPDETIASLYVVPLGCALGEVVKKMASLPACRGGGSLMIGAESGTVRATFDTDPESPGIDLDALLFPSRASAPAAAAAESKSNSNEAIVTRLLHGLDELSPVQTVRLGDASPGVRGERGGAETARSIDIQNTDDEEDDEGDEDDRAFVPEEEDDEEEEEEDDEGEDEGEEEGEEGEEGEEEDEETEARRRAKRERIAAALPPSVAEARSRHLAKEQEEARKRAELRAVTKERQRLKLEEAKAMVAVASLTLRLVVVTTA